MTIATVNYASLDWQADGTPFNRDYGDVYFSRDGGLAESTHVYLHGNRLPARWASHFQHHRYFILAEAGFGTGLNFLNTVRAFRQTSLPEQQLWYYAIEKSPLDKTDLARALSAFPELQHLTEELLAHYPARFRGWHHLRFGQIHLVLIFDDIENALAQIRDSNIRVDAWYLDAFSPAVNSAMWADSILLSIGKLSRAGATASTYSVAGHIRRGLENAGFRVAKKSGFGQKREMTCAELIHKKPDNAAQNLVANNPVHIIGAGIAGCALANELAGAGVHVKLYEKNAMAGTLAQHLAAIACPRWTRDHSIDTQWQLFGLLKLHQLIADDAVLYRGLIESNDFNDDDFLSLGLMPDFVGKCDRGWLQKLALTVRPNALCQQLSEHHNIEMIAREYHPSSHDLIVYCNGAEARKQFYTLPLMAVRGQMSLTTHDSQAVKSECEPFVARQTHHARELDVTISSEIIDKQNAQNLDHVVGVERDEQYRIKFANGQMLIGASFERDCDDLSITSSSHQFNIDKYNLRHPEFPIGLNNIVGGIAGIRLSSRDHMPIVDQIAQTQFVNIAHGSHGLMSAFSAAEKLRALLLGEPQSMPSSWWRKTSFNRFKEN